MILVTVASAGMVCSGTWARCRETASLEVPYRRATSRYGNLARRSSSISWRWGCRQIVQVRGIPINLPGPQNFVQHARTRQTVNRVSRAPSLSAMEPCSSPTAAAVTWAAGRGRDGILHGARTISDSATYHYVPASSPKGVALLSALQKIIQQVTHRCEREPDSQ
jgi:hypothetical protein